MISQYANQNINWKKVKTTDGYDEVATYTEKIITGRKEDGFRLVRNSAGEETVSTGRVYTESAIQIDDYLDGRLVIAIETARQLNGTVGFYTVHLK